MNEEQPISEQPNETFNQEQEPNIVTPVEPEVSLVPPIVQQTNAITPPISTSTKTSQPLATDIKVFAAISYLSILFIIPWITKKDHPFVAFHLKQGIGLFIAEVIVWFCLWLIESFLTTLFSYRAIGLVVVLNKFAWLAFGLISVIGFYFAIKGITKKIPYLEIITKNLKL